MIDLNAPAVRHLSALAEGEYTALELLDASIARIEKHNPSINAIVWTDFDRARDRAGNIIGGPTVEQPLRGLPMTVKEAFNYVGSPTTFGIPTYESNIDTANSVVVSRLLKAGAVIIGKTNVPYALSDLQSYNDIYGTCKNPWDLHRTPGGSSGGSAAALAAGFSALEMGSDIGGSIRTPAHFCGVFGHKPTWALIPVRGHSLPGIEVEPDIAVVGPMARSALDLELALEILAKPDDFQPGIRYELPGLPAQGLSGLRAAVWADDELAPVSAEVRARVHRVATALGDAGASVNFDARPDFKSAESHAVYEPLLWSFMASGATDEEFDDMLTRAAQLPSEQDDNAARMLRYSTLNHREWVRLHNERDKLRWSWHRFFQDFDIVIAPQTPTPAFPHDHAPMEERTIAVDNTHQPYWQQLFWAGLPGIARLPSTVIPTGSNDDGLPIGVQIIAAAYGDRLTVQTAQRLEELGFSFQAPPNYQ